MSISPKIKEKQAAIFICILGILLAIFTPITQFKNFLYLIGSVFAPMIAVLITDYFILKKDVSAKPADWPNLISWGAGFIIYRIFLKIDTPMGNTLPVMLITAFICIAVHKLTAQNTKKPIQE